MVPSTYAVAGITDDYDPATDMQRVLGRLAARDPA